MRTEIAPLLIVTKLEEYDYSGTTAIAVVMLVISFVFLPARMRWKSGVSRTARTIFVRPPSTSTRPAQW
jgi:ABC-type sulfate transport system permease component